MDNSLKARLWPQNIHSKALNKVKNKGNFFKINYFGQPRHIFAYSKPFLGYDVLIEKDLYRQIS